MPSRARWRPLLGTCLLLLSVGSTEARADGPADVAKARELFLEGSKLSESGDWEGARDRFERSLKLKHAALTLYNLGIAQQETGHLVGAIDSFHAFLAMPVEPATQPFVDPVRTVVATLEARVPQVDVEVRPPGASPVTLRIDGKEVPATPGPRRLDPGHHDFSASAPGFCDATAQAALVEGGRTTVALRFAQAPLPPAPSNQLPATLAASGLVVLVGGAVMLGIGGAGGVRATPDPNATKLMLAGGAMEGASAVALGAAAVLLLTRNKPLTASARIVPWASGPVGGVAVRF